MCAATVHLDNVISAAKGCVKAKSWKEMDDNELVGAFLTDDTRTNHVGGIFNRGGGGPIIDPNKPHPIIDALKEAFSNMITTYGPTIIPMIANIIKAWLGNIPIPTPPAA